MEIFQKLVKFGDLGDGVNVLLIKHQGNYWASKQNLLFVAGEFGVQCNPSSAAMGKFLGRDLSDVERTAKEIGGCPRGISSQKVFFHQSAWDDIFRLHHVPRSLRADIIEVLLSNCESAVKPDLSDLGNRITYLLSELQFAASLRQAKYEEYRDRRDRLRRKAA